MEAIYTDEGRITPNGANYQYEYALKDHLGNTRITFADLNNNNVVDVPGDILQENHYYPFGMNMNYSWMNNAGQIDTRYQYNGKELNDDYGLNLSDYGARWYDASVGRWWSVDLMGEFTSDVSLYNYVENNPLIFIDPNGMMKAGEEQSESMRKLHYIGAKPGGSGINLFGDGNIFRRAGIWLFSGGDKSMDRHGRVWIKAKTQGHIQPVTVNVTNEIIGHGTVVSYPQGARVQDRLTSQLYEIPIYRVSVSGSDEHGSPITFDFEAFRFGVQEDATRGIASRMVGLRRAQTHTLRYDWINSVGEMAWRVTRSWFIHRGPRDPENSRYGSIGCIEICGEGEWDRFNTIIQYLSRSTDMRAISNAGRLQAIFQAADLPPLIER